MKISTLICVVMACCTLTIQQSLAQHIVYSRTTGIAPMGVHFTVNDTDWSLITNSDYEWIFPGNDTVVGYQATHTFIEEGGIVTLKITRADNTILTDTLYMSVTTEDMGYPTNGTVCISSTGNFEGAPAGAVHLTASTLESVIFSPNFRYQFRKGDTFSIASSKTLPYLTHYSSYGTESTPPLIMVSGDATTTTFWMADNVAVSNIDFHGVEWVGSSAWGGTIFGEGRLFAPENFATFQNINVKNMTAFAIMDDGIGSKKNLVIDNVHATNLGSYFVYAGVSPSIEYSGIRNSTVYNVLSNHAIRLNGGKYFSVNGIHIDSVERSHITFRGLRHGVISDSKFTGKGFYKNSIRNIADDASTSDSVMYIIFERNQYESRNNEFGIDLNIGNDVVIRNNLFLNSSLNIGINLSAVIPQRVDIIQNTFYQNNFDWYSMITLRAGASGSFKGNIAYADDCIASDCIASNPFPTHSVSTDPNWQINHNAYFVNGDAGGSNFKSGMSWEAWKGIGNDISGDYGSMAFNNKSANLLMADFTPTSGVMIELTPFLTHRDLKKKRRIVSGGNDAGALQLTSSLSVKPSGNLKTHWTYYPNPANNFVIFHSDEIDQITPLKVTIFDNLGKIILQKENYKINEKLNIESLPTGNYLVQISSKNFQRIGLKIVKF